MKCDQLDIFKSSQEGRAAAAPKTGLLDAIKNKTLDRPVMVSLGMGVDSVAMTIALIQLGCVPDLVIFADTVGERPETYAYIETFRSEEHTSELQSLMRISYAVFCLTKKNNNKHKETTNDSTKQ